ncbi:MAG TPA: beta-galactosidase [Bryobacteraceae bacterium]|nr:beta-galactosidase [Bryobacteraceae bacterium]
MFPASAAAPAPEFVQAVEFPYYLYPPTLWERELVWLKNIGIRTVAFSVPWNWHQLAPGDFDFTGRTSPRRDLTGFIRLLRRLGLHAWVRPLPPVSDWLNGGTPAGAADRTAWLKQVENLLGTQTASHGGPVEFIDPKTVPIDAAPPPEPVTAISAIDPQALARSRGAIEKARGTLLWKDVEDALYPAGWRAGSASLLRQGAVGLSGDERPAAAAVRRSAALLRHWMPLLASLQPVGPVRGPGVKLPDSIAIAELGSTAGSAVSISNRGAETFHDDLRLYEPAARRTVTVPNVTVPAGESLWLPLNLSLGPKGLCGDCSNFSVTERLVYATAELLSLEYENGILAMEFSAPAAGEAVLQLERKPVGPFLAGGTPIEFEWDAATMRARLPIPASRAADHHVRIGIAIEEPETAGFFNEAHRLIVGQKNSLVTSYSSAGVAGRSRLRLPEGYTSTAKNNAPDEIEYQVSVPADASHGDFASLTLEADGMPLGRARLQLFRPVTVRLMESMTAHFGQQTELTPEPFTAAIDARAGGTVEILLRNNWPSIQTYRLDAAGDGLTFFPPRSEVSIGAMEERRVPIRIFAEDGGALLRGWTLRLTSAGMVTQEIPMRLVIVPRNGTSAWSGDLYGDGQKEFVLESSKVRAVFSPRDGGRWLEFTAKESNSNFLPEQGVFDAPGDAAVRVDGDALVFEGQGWRRTVRLAAGTLTIEQTTPVPSDGLSPLRQNGVELSMEHPTPTRAIYKLE